MQRGKWVDRESIEEAVAVAPGREESASVS